MRMNSASDYNKRKRTVQPVARLQERTLWCKEVAHIHAERKVRYDELVAKLARGRNIRRSVNELLYDRAVRQSAALKVLGNGATREQMHQLLRKVHARKQHYSAIQWYRQPKITGGFRPICSGIPLDLKAVHYMLKWALEAIYTPPDHIYFVPTKGRDEAARSILSAIRSGYNHLGKTDIVSCFQSINPDSFYESQLPKEVINRALDLRTMQFEEVSVPRHYGGDPIETLNTSGPMGLMQGSPASSTILAWLLSKIPSMTGARVFVCADNILVAATSEHRCRAMIDALAQYFAGCSFGPLTLCETEYASPNDDPVDFLSYSISPDGRDLRISDGALNILAADLGALEELPSISARDYFLSSLAKLRGFINAFSAAPDGRGDLQPHVEGVRRTLIGMGARNLAEMCELALESPDTDEGWLITSVLKASFEPKRHRSHLRQAKKHSALSGF